MKLVPAPLRGLGVRSRLLGLVVVPSLALGVLGADVVRDHAALARGAEQVADEVDEVVLALDALLALTDEFRHAESLVQGHGFGLAPSTVSELLGYDLEDALAQARRDVDANPLVPVFQERVGDPDGLARGRAAFDREPLERSVSVELFDEARRHWKQELAELFGRGAEVPPEREVGHALDSLRSVVELFEISDEQIVLALALMVPGTFDELGPGADLSAVQDRYDDAVREARTVLDIHLRPIADRVLADDAFERSVVAVLDGGSTGDLTDLTSVLQLATESATQHQQLVVAAADDARAHAVAVGAAAQQRYERMTLLLLGVLLVTIVVAIAVARSIARPLRRVARQAAALSAGELDADLVPEDGPREAAVLARALNEAVANLRTLAARMSAMAAGDLEGARRSSTAGRLGELVGRSVDGLARSLTERDSLQRRLAHDAAHDALTGLANRRTTMNRLDALLDANGEVGVLYLDLDGFKHVNDEFGHAVGDRLLIVTARRIAALVDDEDLVARLGGDEFVIGTVVGSHDAVVELADTLVRALDEPFSIDGLPHRVGASIGVAFSMPGDDADSLLRSADNALYAAKRHGRGGVVVLDAALRAEVDENHRIEMDLRTAISANELELHYQPVFEAGGVLYGVEALVRWRRDGDIVPPDGFVPIAERSGLIVDLDRWVLRRALDQLAAWARGPLASLHLSVNVSSRTLLASTFVEEVQEALAGSGIDGAVLTVEVTETALLHDLETAARHITALRELGVRTSVDDFGTGYTSVSHLRRLPVSEVKIDRSFVHAMGSDERERVLVDVVAKMGTMLGLDVVGEGVETQEQLDALRALGCRFAQGFLLGHPVPPEELPAMHAASVAEQAALAAAPAP